MDINSIRKTIAALKAERSQLDAAIAALTRLAGRMGGGVAAAGTGRRKRRKLSAEAKRSISEASKKRWAEWRKKHAA